MIKISGNDQIDKRKIKNSMKISDAIIKTLNSNNFGKANSQLIAIVEDNILTINEIRQLLNLTNKLITYEFISRYKKFTKSQLKYIELFINRNLDNSNRLFVSDLIEFALLNNLNLNYDKCITFLSKFNHDDDYVQLAAIDYICENLKYNYIEEIFNSLSIIVSNKKCNKSAQLKSLFHLYKISHNPLYFEKIRELILFGPSNLKELLQNLLALPYNNINFYDKHDMLNALLNSDKTSNDLLNE